MGTTCRVLLVGGGHSHVEVLRRFARAPDRGVALTLVSPEADTAYSGMLPGLVAGLYTHRAAHIALPPLAARAGATFIMDRVVALDVATRTCALASGNSVAFDLASLDVGSVPDAGVPGAREHALPVKPVASFLVAWDALRAAAAAGALRRIVVVGGGAGGVELLLSMQARLAAESAQRAPGFALCSDQPEVLMQHPAIVRARFAATLAARGVELHLGDAVTAVEPGRVRLASGGAVEGDCIVWATAASAPAWLAASGLACDPRGFVLVDAHLRSPSHPFVFAAGDCATQVGHPRPKAGVYAVRQGPPLAANLRRAAHGRALAPFVPQRDALALISTGERHAIAARGPFVAEGDWVWRWKDWIDRRFMAKYAVAGPPLAPAAGTPT
jgi:selenide, water dikinase